MLLDSQPWFLDLRNQRYRNQCMFKAFEGSKFDQKCQAYRRGVGRSMSSQDDQLE